MYFVRTPPLSPQALPNTEARALRSLVFYQGPHSPSFRPPLVGLAPLIPLIPPLLLHLSLPPPPLSSSQREDRPLVRDLAILGGGWGGGGGGGGGGWGWGGVGGGKKKKKD